MTDGLVGGYHRSCQLKAAVVAVVLHQGQTVVLFWRREGLESEKIMDTICKKYSVLPNFQGV